MRDEIARCAATGSRAARRSELARDARGENAIPSKPELHERTDTVSDAEPEQIGLQRIGQAVMDYGAAAHLVGVNIGPAERETRVELEIALVDPAEITPGHEREV